MDRITLAAVEAYGVDRMLRELRQDLQAGTYRPAPARRVDIPEPQGGTRPLGIPTVRDRVAQQAARIVLEPIFEADPRSRSAPERHHRLKGTLGTAVWKGEPLAGGWQYEVTGGGRIWYMIDDMRRIAWITYAGTGHPKATD